MTNLATTQEFSSHEVLVRPATPEDTVALAGILKVLAAHTYPGRLSANALTALTQWLNNDQPHSRFVADSGAGVIGHIQLNTTPTIPTPPRLRNTDALEVARLFVHPSHQRQGVATALMAATEAHLRAEGVPGYLGIPEHQSAAHALIDQRNWRPMGTHNGPGGHITLYRSPT